MLIRFSSLTGQPLYLQLMQQIRHAAESGAVQDGYQLPSIRALAEELVISPNTVAKAYAELEHEGMIELRQGSGAFLTMKPRPRRLTEHMHAAAAKLADVIEELKVNGLSDEEIRRVFETALLSQSEAVGNR